MSDFKQETVEEAAERFIKKQTFNSLEIDDKIFQAILFGAKWQQKRMYSEEEVYNLLYKLLPDDEELNEWFKQYKKIPTTIKL